MSASWLRPRSSASDAIQLAAGQLEEVGIPADNIYEALIECVRSAGGSKAVAADLWPAVAARNLDEARRRLANCLSPERAEKLSLDEMLAIARMARSRGCHVLMQYLCRTLGYQAPHPVTPEEEADELKRQFVAATAELSKLAERIQQLERPGPRAVA